MTTARLPDHFERLGHKWGWFGLIVARVRCCR
jgi:hypothetical protein